MEETEWERGFRSGLEMGYRAGFGDAKIAGIIACGDLKCDVDRYMEMMNPKKDAAPEAEAEI